MSEQVNQQVAEQVRAIIAEVAEDRAVMLGEVTDDTPLFSDHRDEGLSYLDSFEAVMILIELENTFNFQINDEDMDIEHFDTIRQIVQYIEEHQAPPVL